MSKIFAEGDWRDLGSISVFKLDEVEWKTVEKGYVYTDLYGWEVFYPTPVTPTFNNIVTSTAFNGSSYTIEAEIDASNAVSIFVELYDGTSPTGTPIQTGFASYDSISYLIEFTGLNNNSYYSLKFLATSQTEDTSEDTESSIYINVPFVDVTSVNVSSSTDVTVNWSSSNQVQWRARILESDGFTEVATSGAYTTSSATSYTFNLNNALSSKTNYYAEVNIFSSNNFATDKKLFTTPSFTTAESVISSVTPGYESLSVLWTNNQYVNSGSLKLYEAVFTQQGGWEYNLQQTYNFTTQTSYTFSNLSSGTLYYIELVGFYNGTPGPVSTWGPDYTLTPTAPDPPTMIAFRSLNYFWSLVLLGVAVNWTIPDSNGSTVTGYVLQYRNSPSANWSTVYNGSDPGTTGVSFTVSNTAQTIYLRMYTKSSDQGNSTYSYQQFTINSGLLPSLSATRTSAGYTVSHSNYSSSYSYNGSVESPGSISGTVESQSFDVNVDILYNGTRPTLSVNRTTRVFTVSYGSTWSTTPTVETTVISSRDNHTTRSSDISSYPSRTSSYFCSLEYSTDQGVTWVADWKTGSTASTSFEFTPYSINITRSRLVRCKVTVYSGPYSNTRTSNTITIP